MPNKSLIAAGIDIGSNSFRILIAQISGGQLTVLAKKLVTVRLGRQMTRKRRLSPEAMEKALSVLRSFRSLLAEFQPQVCRACGTAALRIAGNAEEFLRPAQKILGAKIEVISGDEEARLNLTGALALKKSARTPPLPPILLADVGGSSTELILVPDSIAGDAFHEPESHQTASLPLGAVGLTEKFLHSAIPEDSEVMRMTGFIREILAPAIKRILVGTTSEIRQVVGTGGTATSMAAADLNLGRYSESIIQGHVLPEDGIDRLWDRLVVLPPAKRNQLPGLAQDRGEIILAGIRIYQVLLELLGRRRLVVSDAGMLEGILLSGARMKYPSLPLAYTLVCK